MKIGDRVEVREEFPGWVFRTRAGTLVPRDWMSAGFHELFCVRLDAPAIWITDSKPDMEFDHIYVERHMIAKLP